MIPSLLRRSFRHGALALLVPVLFVTVPGCAHKSVEAPPAPAVRAPAPAQSPKADRQEEAAPGTDGALLVEFTPAFFDYDSFALRKDAREALDRTARTLREKPGLRVVLEGHCDERGTPEYNLALGERRAAIARDYLMSAGIAADRISVISYGKERPFAGGHDETAWALNRRAHVVAR